MKWSAMGLSHLAGKGELSNEDLKNAINGLGSAFDAFVDELATMFQNPGPLTHRQTLTLNKSAKVDSSNNSLAPTITLSGLGIDASNFDDYFATGWTVNDRSQLSNSDTQVTGGLAQGFVGVVLIDGALVLNGNVVNNSIITTINDDNEWIEATTSGTTTTISHIGPGGQGTPEDIGSAAEGNEAADSNDGTCNGTNGLDVFTTSRVGYFESGDETLYGYMREWKFDKKGHLISVSAETRYTINAPDDC